MPRKKNVVKSLIDSAEAAFFAGVEIHNKPRIPYRYPTATLLIINAWELVLKAYIYKYISKKLIFVDKNHTITFSKALVYVHEHINKREQNKNFNAVNDNLFLLAEYRNNNTHFFEQELDPIIFMLLSKATLNFNEFLEKYFHREITDSENLIILPIGFKLPFDPIEYLNKKSNSVFSSSYVCAVIDTIKRLNDEDVSDSIVVGFDMFINAVKKLTNADIVAAIDQSNYDAISLTKTIKLTDDENAPVARIDEFEIIKQQYPLTFDDLKTTIKEKLPTVKFNGQFYNYLRLIKENKEWYKVRLLNPWNPKSPKTGFYSVKAVDELIILYENNHEDKK